MNKLLLVVLVILSGGIWYMAMRLSPDAIALSIGFVLGMIPGLGSCLLVLAATRGNKNNQRDQAYPSYPPPVYLMSGNAGYGQQESYAPPPPQLVSRNNQKSIDTTYTEW